MILDIKKAVTLDTFVRELANVDKDVARVSSKIEMFLDKGQLQKIAIQVSWNAEDHYFILDGDMKLITKKSYDKYSSMHPKLDEIIDNFIGEETRKKRVTSFNKNKLAFSRKDVNLLERPLFGLKNVNAL